MDFKKRIPATGEEFEMTFDPRLHLGMFMLHLPLALEVGRVSAKRWSHSGPVLSEYETRMFKLVQVGECWSTEELTEKLLVHGRIPAGQWIKPFYQRFRVIPGEEYVGIFDPSWFDHEGRKQFPCIYHGEIFGNGLSFRYGRSYPSRYHPNFSSKWRWIVECS